VGGAKHPCSFCGLNGGSSAFRQKASAKVLDEIESLASSYGVKRLQAVDNILPYDFLRKGGLLEQLATGKKTARLAYEV